MKQEKILKQKYYILTTHFECPVCGSGEAYQERVNDKKKAGHEIIDSYDYCLEF